MPTLTIDGAEIDVPAGVTVLQACELAGKEIPHFCYHERLSVAGNCRMCLVEMERSPKPIASCAMPVGDGMVIRTDTETVRKARRGVMEFLLINHPLDCPICDQGGECDLQDQAMAYGFDRSRFSENKRAVDDKYMGPLIKTVMTRCIHCTRCVRFAAEVAGVEDLGMLYRGEKSEITTYLEQALTSELSGNVIDLCPVGALTSKPYAFVARSWELHKTESVDVFDAVGAAIRVDTRGAEVQRVLPRLNEDVNEEWLSDKSRFAVDGLKRQRLDRPFVRGADGRLEEASWKDALAHIADRMKGVPGERIAAIAGDQCDAESMLALKDLMQGLGSPHVDCRQDGAKLDASTRASYLLNSTIAGLETADALLLVGTNPRWEAPLVGARLRKAWLAGARIAAIGPGDAQTYEVEEIGAGPDMLQHITRGSHPFSDHLRAAERPALILGMGALARPDGAAVLAAARNLAADLGLIRFEWNGFNVLHTAAARVAGLDLGVLPQEGGRNVAGILDGAGDGSIEAVYLLGADEIDMSGLGEAFVVYQGHHGDTGAHRADVVLPGAAYTEKNGTYVNTEGRVQLGHRAMMPVGDAREDWTILRALSDALGAGLTYTSLGDVRRRMVEVNPVFDRVGELVPAPWAAFGTEGELHAAPFRTPIENFHMTDPISRASQTMAACAATFSGQARTGTHG